MLNFDIDTAIAELLAGGKAEYPASHSPAMIVPKGGSSCAKCKYLAENKKDCTNEYFQKWHGSPTIPAPIAEFCSDWFESRDDIEAYGTSEGVTKGWDTRGRGRADKITEAINSSGWLDRGGKFHPFDVLQYGHSEAAAGLRLGKNSEDALKRGHTRVVTLGAKAIFEAQTNDERTRDNIVDALDKLPPGIGKVNLEFYAPAHIFRFDMPLADAKNWLSTGTLGLNANRELERRTEFRGLKISIETDKGSTREGVGKDGKPWKVTMTYPYGYIRMSEGVDGDHVDAFLGPNEAAENVYVVHTNEPSTGKYDEDKCFVGFDSAEDAKKAFLENYNNPKFFGAMEEIPFEKFKEKVLATKAEPTKIAAYGTSEGVTKGWDTRGRGRKEEEHTGQRLMVAPEAPSMDKPIAVVFGGSFNPPHTGHVGAARDAAELLKEAGYNVDKIIIAPTADKLLKVKLGEREYPLAERTELARKTFSPDMEVTSGPAEEAEGTEGKLRRTQLADWVQRQYPDHTVVNVTGEDAAPGHPPGYPSLYSGDKGSNHEGYYYLAIPRPAGATSSSQVREAIRQGIKPEEMTPEAYEYLKTVFQRHPEIKAELNLEAAIQDLLDLQAESLFHGVKILGFTGPEEEFVRATASRVPPELMTHVKRIIAAPWLGAKHGRYMPDTGTIFLNPKNVNTRARVGEGQGWIEHGILTTIHEIGHSVYDNLSDTVKRQWMALSGWMKGTAPGQDEAYEETRPGWEHEISKWTHRSRVKFPRKYSKKNPDEDFADSFAYYFLNKAHQIDKGKKEFLDKLFTQMVLSYPKYSVESPDKPYAEKHVAWALRAEGELDINAAVADLLSYGTSEGVTKAWDTRGRGRKEEEKQPWQISRKEYEGQFPGENRTDAEMDAYWKRGREWNKSMGEALSLGKLTLEEARKLGDFQHDKMKPLPSVLYHVTTSADKVEQEGLKSRDELNQGLGAGLGGGPGDTISFTEDLNTARAIRRGIMEAKAVTSGQLTIEKMLQLAKDGHGAKGPWISDLLRYYGREDSNWKPGDKYPIGLDTQLRGMTRAQAKHFGYPPDESGQWKPAPDTYHWKGGDDQDLYTIWERPATEDEKREDRFEFYKRFATFRESAGGPFDPLFFAADEKALSRLSPKDVAIMQFAPVPGAMGTQEHALGEWRAYTGKAVKLVHRIKAEAEDVEAYGTSEGVAKSWDTRGRGRKSQDEPITGDGWIMPDGKFLKNVAPNQHAVTLRRLGINDYGDALEKGMVYLTNPAHNVFDLGTHKRMAEVRSELEKIVSRLPEDATIAAHTGSGVDYDTYDWEGNEFILHPRTRLDYMLQAELDLNAAVADLLAGGPGSGCNPEVAEPRCGRPSGSEESNILPGVRLATKRDGKVLLDWARMKPPTENSRFMKAKDLANDIYQLLRDYPVHNDIFIASNEKHDVVGAMKLNLQSELADKIDRENGIAPVEVALLTVNPRIISGEVHEKGTGTKLMVQAARVAASRKVGLELIAAVGAETFYDKLGMHKEGQWGYYWTPEEAEAFAKWGTKKTN